eukprot:3110276-Alexandrium_andersonii.AAC.1
MGGIVLMSVVPRRRAPTSLMARWLAPESTTHGTGLSLERSSSAKPPSRPNPRGRPRLVDVGQA